MLPGTICRQRIISEIKQKFSIEQINDISKFNQYKIVLCPEATESQGYVSPIFPRVLESGSIIDKEDDNTIYLSYNAFTNYFNQGKEYNT